jgi:hypothetical protein
MVDRKSRRGLEASSRASQFQSASANGQWQLGVSTAEAHGVFLFSLLDFASTD